MTISSVTEPARAIIRSLEASGEDGLKPVPLDRILLGPDALHRLPAEVESVRRPGPVVILEDATTMRREGEDLKALVAGMLAPLGEVRRVVLGPADGRLKADQATIDQARGAVEGAGCVVTVGSGTLTDVGKEAVNLPGGPPLVVVQTAASVNGYADDMAVVLRDGVKRTVPSIWPAALVIDTQVIRDAPAELTRSGFAEMMAMFTAPADWRLAGLVGLDRSFSRAVVDLFRPDGERLLTAATGIRNGQGEALDLLSTLLTSSGMAMGAAGRTAPLSGTEHLVSHLLDMSAGIDGRPVGLHGAQVGVAAVVAACVWEHVLGRLDPERLRATVEQDGLRERVEEAFGVLGPGRAAECWSDYRRKLDGWEASEDGRKSLDWEAGAAELRALIGEPAAMASALAGAGAPSRFSDLEPPIGADRVRWALASAHLMRNRFTIVDLAFLTGNWSDEDVEAVLARAGELGGGL